MKTHLLTACLALGLRAIWAGDVSVLDVSVIPSTTTLPADEEQAAVKYRFTNPMSPDHLYPALHPPSGVSVEPVTKLASSLARYSAAAAISAGFPMRPIGCVELISS